MNLKLIMNNSTELTETQEETAVSEELVGEEEEESTVQALDIGGWAPSSITYYGPHSRSVLITGEINSEVAAGIISQLLTLDSINDEPIRVYINTPGGSVIDAMAIYDIMMAVSSPIITVVAGACFSAGLILQAAGDLRVATQNSMFFYHEPVMSLIDIQRHEGMQSGLEYYEWSRNTAERIIRKRASISKKVWARDFHGRTSKNFTVKQALKYGLLDELIVEADKPEVVLEGD